MSLTTTSGAKAPMSGRVTSTARADRLVGPERLAVAREDRELGRGREAQPLALGVRRPARPRLQQHVVAAGAQRAAEGQEREGVPGVAERAEEDPQAASRHSATRRSCVSRSSFVKASGVTPSVPTPASR